MTPTNSSQGPRKAAVIFIFITVLLDMLALGMIIPVLPKLVVDFMGGDTARGAAVYGLFGTVWALMQFFFSPILGALSDRFGRRPTVLMSNFGLGFDYILMALAPSIQWLFIGRVISGITAASISTAGAYLADVTSVEKRAASFGLLGAAFGLGFVLGPAVGGLLGDIDSRLPFWVAASLSLVNGMYGYFVLPESLPLSKRSAFSWRKANPIGSLKLLRSSPELLGLAAVTFLSYLAHESLPIIGVLYASYRYGWDAKTVGLSLAAIGICSAVVQAVLVRPLVGRFGERNTMFAGLFFGCVGFTIYGFAPTGWLYCFGIPFMSLWGMTNPALQGLMTPLVKATEQGQLQGAISSIRGISGMLGPGLFALTFASFIAEHRERKIPGASFLIAAFLLAGAWFLAFRLSRRIALARSQE